MHNTTTIIKAREQDSPFWKRIAKDLDKSSRARRVVNLSRISRYSTPGETIVVPGKVLGTGDITHALTIVAGTFSTSALEKLKEAKCTVMTIDEFLAKNPKGSGRIIG